MIAMKKPTVAVLFCGCGGEALGFRNAGFKIAWANDNNKWACETFKKYFKIKPSCKDIRKIEEFPKVDIVTGGYPCQGFSLAGNRLVTDKRNYLYLEFARCLNQVQPKFFFAENVPGLLSLGKGNIFEAMKNEFRNIGIGYEIYTPEKGILNAKNYGVAQERQRVFIIGVRKDLNFVFEFPEPTNGDGKSPYVTLRQAIGNLPMPKEDEVYDSGFSFIYMSRNRRKDWDDVSFTIQAGARHAPLHPSSSKMIKVRENVWKFKNPKNVRRLSYKECALIQSFPRSFVFKGPLIEKYKQIGNSVPPLLAQRIAEKIMPFFKVNKNAK
jgi:DNA (cytosine-5)-methyltransferase 1